MEDETTHQELLEAEKALKEGRFDAADRHLDLAAHSGATPLHISDLGRRLRSARAAHDRGVRGSVRVGFLIALAGYLILSARQPLGWTISAWMVLAFIIIPGIAGLFVGRRHAGTRTRSLAFFDGVRSGVYAMACYSAIHIFTLANNLQKDSNQLVDEWVAAIIAIIVYSAIAGGVAGISSVAASFLRPRGDMA